LARAFFLSSPPDVGVGHNEQTEPKELEQKKSVTKKFDF
jgi:hypothetical protein